MSNTRKLTGIMGPVISTFVSGSEDLDVPGFVSNIRAHIADGLSGIVIAGSTGEAALLSEEERVTLIEAARGEVPSDRWLIAGTGAESARQAVARCRAAKSAGADAVLVVAPHYYSNAMTEEALEAHYLHIANNSPLPVLLYNIPKFMHFALSAQLVARLAGHENIVGIKDSSGDVEMLKGFLRAQSDSFTVITGSASALQAGLDAGARGGILAASLFVGRLSIDLFNAHGAGDTARATELQERLAPIANVIVAKLGVPGVKAAMDHAGRVGGVPRLPLLKLSSAQAEEMRAALG